MKRRKLKILFIKPGDTIRNHIWAMHQFILKLSSYNNLDVFFITDNFEFESNSQIKTFHGYPGLPKSIEIISAYFKRLKNVIAILKKVKPDIIHINNHIGAFDCLLFARIFRPGAKVILDIRTLPDKDYKYLYYRIITPFFDWVFALNDTIFKKLVRNSNHSLLPLGFDDNVFAPSGSPRVAYQKRTHLKCIYYGSLDRKRKLNLMIKGFIDAIKSGCDIRLTVIGTGNGKDELLEEVKCSDVSERITFASHIPQNQLVEIIRNHDLGISFIPNEGMYVPQVPLKTVEMLACGLPVIATDTPGNTEIVENYINGFIASDTAEGVASALRGIWERGIPNEMPDNSIASVGHLTWKLLTERYLIKVYEQLLGTQS